MAKVYVVTNGEYSDYRIVGIFDDKKQAELYQATSFKEDSSYCDCHNYEIEEYELNETKLCGDVFYGIRACLYNNNSCLDVEKIRSISPIKPHITTNCYGAKFYYFPTESEWTNEKAYSAQGRKIVYDKIAELDAEEKGVL